MLMLDGFTVQCKIIHGVFWQECKLPDNGQQKRDEDERAHMAGIPPSSKGWKCSDTMGDNEDNIDDESVITLTKPWNRAQSLWHFTLTKEDILDHVVDSSEILHKLTEKSLLKQAAEIKTQTF